MKHIVALVLGMFVAAGAVDAHAASFPRNGAYSGSGRISCTGSCEGIASSTSINFRIRRVGSGLSFRANGPSFVLRPSGSGFVGQGPNVNGNVNGDVCLAQTAAGISNGSGGRVNYASRIVVSCESGQHADVRIIGTARFVRP